MKVIDDENLFRVALTIGNQLVIGYYRGQDFSPREALNLAAWLQQLALEAGGDFNYFAELCEKIEAARRTPT